MPEFTIDSMTENLLLRVNVDRSVDAKVTKGTGSLRINGQLITTTSTVFTRIYPQ